MSLAKQIVSNTFIQMLWRVTTALMALIAIKLITTTIWVWGYWIYTTVYEFLALFAIAWDFGIYTIALREMASKLKLRVPATCVIPAKAGIWISGEDSRLRGNDKSLRGNDRGLRGNDTNTLYSKEISFIYQNVLWLRIVLIIIFMGIWIISAFLIPKYQWTLIPYWVLITSLTVIANLVNSMATSILQLHLRMTYATYSLILWKIVAVWLIAYWAFFIKWEDPAFFFFLIAWVIWNSVMLWFSLFFAKKFTDILPKFNLKYWKEIFKKSAPYWIALILWTLYFKIDVIFISLLRTNEEVWVYAIGLRIIEVFTVLPIFFMNSVLPSLTRAIESSKEKIKNLLQLSFQFLAIAWIPLIFWSILVSEFIIRSVSSDEFVSWGIFTHWWDVILILLMIAMVFSFFSNFISISFVAFKEQKKVLIINSIWVIVNIVLNLIYIPKYWFIAAWFTSIISEITIFIFWFILFQKTYSFIPKIIPILKIIFSSLIMFGIWLYLKSTFWEWNIQSLWIIFSCTLIYTFLIYLLKVVNMKDIKLIGE